MPQICAIPIKPLRRRAFRLDGLITPTLKAAGSNPVGRTTANLLISMGSRFLFYLRINSTRPFSNILSNNFSGTLSAYLQYSAFWLHPDARKY